MQSLEPVHSASPGKKPPGVKPTPPVISILLNPGHYFVHMAFIAHVQECYRLVVFCRGRLMTDEIYDSVRGAKVAFGRAWAYRKDPLSHKPRWSEPYRPRQAWLSRWFDSISESRYISMLLNSLYFFIEIVFILKDGEEYRLVAVHEGRVLADETYAGFEEAKQVFWDRFKGRRHRRDQEPMWSFFYPPEPDWLNTKLMALE